jgi:hypothetical protein
MVKLLGILVADCFEPKGHQIKIEVTIDKAGRRTGGAT